MTVSFDGFKALNELVDDRPSGELRTIIGPNGAGKTTMMDVITGKTQPDVGEVLFNGDIDLTRLDETAIANLGIGRKFQKPTVFENHRRLREPGARAQGQSAASGRPCSARLSGEQRDRIDEILKTIGLADRAGERAGRL